MGQRRQSDLIRPQVEVISKANGCFPSLLMSFCLNGGAQFLLKMLSSLTFLLVALIEILKKAL